MRARACRLSKGLETALDLCQRNEMGSEQGKEGKLYFVVLDRLIQLKDFLRLDSADSAVGKGSTLLTKILHDLLQQLVLRIVSSNSSIVLTNIVERVTTDGNLLGDFRDILGAIMGSCLFEVNVCDAAEGVMVEDLGELRAKKKEAELRGLRGASEEAQAVSNSPPAAEGRSSSGDATSRFGKGRASGGPFSRGNRITRKVARSRENKAALMKITGGMDVERAQFVGNI